MRWELLDGFGVIVFIVSVLGHLTLILWYRDELKGQPGNHFEVIARLRKKGGFGRQALSFTYFGIVFCFAYWACRELLSYIGG